MPAAPLFLAFVELSVVDVEEVPLMLLDVAPGVLELLDFWPLRSDVLESFVGLAAPSGRIAAAEPLIPLAEKGLVW